MTDRDQTIKAFVECFQSPVRFKSDENFKSSIKSFATFSWLSFVKMLRGIYLVLLFGKLIHFVQLVCPPPDPEPV